MLGMHKEFANDFIAKLGKQDDRLQRNSLRLSMEQIMVEKSNPTVAMAMVIIEYTAQFGFTRWTLPTCGVKSSHKHCVIMVSCKPEAATRHIWKWGKIDASVKDVADEELLCCSARHLLQQAHAVFSSLQHENQRPPSLHEEMLHHPWPVACSWLAGPEDEEGWCREW